MAREIWYTPLWMVVKHEAGSGGFRCSFFSTLFVFVLILKSESIGLNVCFEITHGIWRMYSCALVSSCMNVFAFICSIAEQGIRKHFGCGNGK